MPHNDDCIADLSELCIELAVEAASTAASGRSHQPTFTSATKSSATDLVTPFDQAAERFIRAQLSTQRPHDGIIGEEESDLTGTSGLTWIVDPAYLSRIFRRFHKDTPYKFLVRLKMSHAASLLLTTGNLVKNIAFELGFENPFHFSRAFKSVYGISPESFVKQRRLERKPT